MLVFSVQIWALAVSPETEKLATGGGDSVVNMWTDCTIDDEEEVIRQEVKVMRSPWAVFVVSFFERCLSSSLLSISSLAIFQLHACVCPSAPSSELLYIVHLSSSCR